MYITVYAPDGKMFEVSRDRADKLLLDAGWTQTRPKIKKVSKKSKKSEDVVFSDIDFE